MGTDKYGNICYAYTMIICIAPKEEMILLARKGMELDMILREIRLVYTVKWWVKEIENTKGKGGLIGMQKGEQEEKEQGNSGGECNLSHHIHMCKYHKKTNYFTQLTHATGK